VFTPSSQGPDQGDKSTAPPDRISLFAQDFFEGAGPALTTMMNRPIGISILGIENIPAADLRGRLPLPWVMVEMTYARGLSGSHHLIFGKSGALILGHAVIGEGEADAEALEFTPAVDDAIREIVNQILGAASTALMPLIRRSVGFEPLTSQLVEDSATIPSQLSTQAGRLWLVRAEATGPDGFRVDFSLTIGPDLAHEIATVGVEVDEPAGVPAARPANAPVGLDLILDVTLPVAVELGRARLQIQDILNLVPGSIVELDKSAGDAVEILINDRPIAKGEVVVIDENFGVRLTSIVTAAERIKTLR
jgi:flagellar motor switch protein FliN/FliY